MARLILLDDSKGQLGPLGDLRASFEQRSGAFTALERSERSFGVEATVACGDQTELVQERTGRCAVDCADDSEAILVNGRLAIGGRLESPPLGTVRLDNEGNLAIARLKGDALVQALSGATAIANTIDAKPGDIAKLWQFPWDILDGLGDRITADGELLDAQISPSAQVHPSAVLDTTNGPVLLHEGATVRPLAVLIGPCSIGPHSVVGEHALIKAATAIGPVCRVAGEIGSTVLQAFTNKSHDGHLGDALVGEWVNFGAGTTNSNLLNTYGEVLMRLEHDGGLLRTNRTFMGSVIGDHAKFAINTRLMTGTTIGTAAMVASTAAPPAFTRRFTWLTDQGARLYQWRKFEQVAQAVVARRGLSLGAAAHARLQAVHERAASTGVGAS